MESSIKDVVLFEENSLGTVQNILESPGSNSLRIEGLYSSSKALLIAKSVKSGLHFVLMNSREDAEYCSNDLYNLYERDAVYFLPSTLNSNLRRVNDISSVQVQRSAALKALSDYSAGTFPGKALIIVAYPHSVAESVVNRGDFASKVLRISKGDTLSHDFIKEFLFEYGFEKSDFVTEPGQFALRGSLIDIFSFADNKPCRIDFFGDSVESIKCFDINTQITNEEISFIDIIPDPLKFIQEEERVDIFNYSEGKKVLWINDFDFFCDQLGKIGEVSGYEGSIINVDTFNSVVDDNCALFLSDHHSSIKSSVLFSIAPQPVFNKNFEILANDIIARTKDGYRVYICSTNIDQTERLKSIFSSIGTAEPIFDFLNISLHEGFIDHQSKVCIYTDHQIFERYHKVKTERSVEKSERLTINDLNSFQIGDYVVHIDHGVGVFGGLVRTNINGKPQEVIKLIYRDSDVLFVSIHGLHRISRYKSKDSAPPKVYKLGTGAWQKLKNQTKSKVKDIARELIDLYSKRKSMQGFSFSPDSYLQHELEASFIYEDTPDQSKATIAIKEDMERPYPMDRLICGDVGFGKTELAIRAAFKAVADSKQVAVLVPTTILALQHYKTFSSRLKEFPCKISYLSRLKSSKEIKDISAQLERGEVDIIIGTHRLLNRDIKFKDLGLLIIDEEQKFGVAAKERLRQIKAEVDTLTLSATPIPRTLQFSLLGARDLSIINTPPPNRLPVQTEIIDFNEDVIRDALNFELNRGGQVYFVHNRIEDIYSVEDIIRRLVPNAKCCVGHGRMDPATLEKIVLDFIVGDYDVLISTTIVENGIDVPNANTIIINQAQNFGLSDLHQLRGRVGRSNSKAFCYLIVPSLLSVTDDARRRLRAIEAFSDLGSGFNIAMQDLDIRGAGNLLGGEQSGFIADMGFETYQRILNEAFIELKEERGIKDDRDKERESKDIYITDCTIDTDLELLIPDDYISITAEKIRLYKELDAIGDDKDLERFMREIEDRFGPVPEQLRQLAFIVRLRKLAIELGFEKIVIKNRIMYAYFITNHISSYYKSDVFAKILNYIQQQSRRFTVKEQNNKLYITVGAVESVEGAFVLLKEISKSVNEKG